MGSFLDLFRRVPSTTRRAATNRKRAARPSRLLLETLEDRCVPTTISSSFSATALAPGSTIWFNSIVNTISGLGSSPATIHVTNQTITFTDTTAGSVNVPLPNADLTINPGGGSATTSFDSTHNKWVSSDPSGLAGNLFLSGYALSLPGGLHGGNNPVTWSGTFTTDTSGLSFKWAWAAAAYSSFTTTYSSVGVKPCDSSTASSYANTDKAGSPENYKGSLVSGAKGNGGTNYTGSFTGAITVTPTYVPTFVTIAGTVYQDDNNNGVLDSGEPGISGVTMNLTGTTTGGQTVSATTTTASDGTYSFTTDINGNNLLAGTYQVSEVQPAGYYQGSSTVGTVNGSADGTVVPGGSVSSIGLSAGQSGTGYNFGEVIPYTSASVPYPYSSSNPLTGVVFNESQVLTGASINVANGTFNVFFSDEHALTLGIRGVNVKLTGSTVSGSKTVTVATANLVAGQAVSGTGIPNGTTIASVGGSTITLSSNATATGSTTLTFTTTYSVSPLSADPSSLTNPSVGATATTGVQAGVDASGRPIFPSMYLTDITANSSSTSGDWQFGGTAIAPSAVNGSWKAFTKTVDYTLASGITHVALTSNVATLTANNSFTTGQVVLVSGLANSLFNGLVTITSATSTTFSYALTHANVATTSDSGTVGVVTSTADADPAANDWNLGSGADPLPSGMTDYGYGAEVEWNLNSLYNQGLLIPEHNYRLYFIVHDGDQTRVGGDCGQVAYNFTYLGPVTISGNVYKDVYGNGVDSAGDTGIGGVTLTLTGTTATGQSVTATTTTAADGTYTFARDSNNNLLHGGTYQITETPPAGYLPGKNTVGLTDWTPGFQTALSRTDTSGAGHTPGYVHDSTNSASDRIFIGANSLDTKGISQWQSTTGKPAATTDLADTFGVNFADSLTGHSFFLAGMDRYSNTANTTVGFWAFQNAISVNANGTFSGVHSDGDLFVVVNVSVNGATAVSVYRWTGTDASGTLTAVTPPAGATDLFVNNSPTSVPWSFSDSTGSTSPQAGELLEVGVDLNAVYGLTVPHFTSFLTETRSSNAPGATLLDLAAGTLNSVSGSFTANGSLISTNQIASIAITDGQNGINYNFGEVQPVTISGLVYHDLNGNGALDTGEPGIAGVTLTLTGTNNLGQAVTATTTSAADGTYSFSTDSTGKLVAPGTYQLIETQPSGYLQGTDTVGTVNGTSDGTLSAVDTISSIGLTTGQNGVNYNFGEVKAVSISGLVYEDTNGNGLLDTGEPGISGVTLTLSGTNNLGQAITATTTTAANGTFTFSTDSGGNGLRPGTYQVAETLPSGYLAGTNKVGTVNGVTDGTLLAGNKIGSIVMTSGQSGINYNFGDVRAVTISGLVYQDSNGNGLLDAGEPGIGSVTLTLSGTNGLGQAITATTSTLANGTYSFSTDSSGNGLLPGTYQVAETLPGGYLAGTNKVGTVNGVTDGTLLAGNKIGSIVMTSGQAGINYNFGDVKPDTLAGTVYQDINRNGALDSGEPGIGGVTLTLSGTNGLGQAITATTTTGANGTYSFSSDSNGNVLLPGTYQIAESQPSGYYQGSNTVGTVNGTADGVLVPTDKIGSIVLASGQGGVNYNFGEIKPVTISGTVYYDANANGVLDNGESGIGGVTLTLTGTTVNGQAVSVTTTTAANGTYTFITDSSGAPLWGGTYQVAETQPSGYLQGKNTVGTVNGTADGALVPTDKIGSIVIAAGQNGINYNFGEVKPVTIGGTVYEDVNSNFTLDTGEPGIANVTLTLTGTSNTGQSVTVTTTTGVNGTYSFSTDGSGNPLPPGTYQVSETTPSGFVQVVANVGTVNGTVDGTQASTGSISSILLASAQAGINYNFGLTVPVSVSGFVYMDNNNDQLYDDLDDPVQGQQLQLTGTDLFGQKVSMTATTDANGHYVFAGMLPGTYTVTLVSPAYNADAANVGTVNGVTDGQADSSFSMFISQIVLRPGDSGVNYNFGLQSPIA